MNFPQFVNEESDAWFNDLPKATQLENNGGRI